MWDRIADWEMVVEHAWLAGGLDAGIEAIKVAAPHPYSIINCGGQTMCRVPLKMKPSALVAALEQDLRGREWLEGAEADLRRIVQQARIDRSNGQCELVAAKNGRGGEVRYASPPGRDKKAHFETMVEIPSHVSSELVYSRLVRLGMGAGLFVDEEARAKRRARMERGRK